MDGLRGRVAVVTGAASGIGRALADRFAGEGMRVVLADVEQAALDRARDEVAATGAAAIALRTDVSRLEDVEALAERTYGEFGAAHVVCNNAGVGTGGMSWEQSDGDWRWVLGVNLWGVIHGVRAFVPRMIAGGEDGHIVNTASLAGLTSGPGNAPYAVSKHGVVALSESLFYELRVSGTRIGVSVLCPGFVSTSIMDSGRNRPAEAGAPGAQPDPAGAAWVRGMIAGGMPPADVAEQVLDAVRQRRFYVLTHPEFDPAIRARVEAILERRDPPGLEA